MGKEERNELAEKVISLLKNHPDNWATHSGGVQNSRTKIRIDMPRFFKTRISLESHFVVYRGATSRKLRKALFEWYAYNNDKLEMQSIENIDKALKSTEGLKAADAAKLRKTGDIS